MRGMTRTSRMTPPRPINEAISRPTQLPAPYDGWNARGNLTNMKPTEAIQMDNLFPGVQDVTLRKGCIDWKTAAPANVHSFLPYSGLTTNKLFAATTTNIYDVTSAGAFGASVQACTNGFWKSIMTATAGGNFLFALNGVDHALTYDGATWANPTITGVADTSLIYPHLHKRRIWAIQQNTMNLWYLGTDSIAGAATQFPVGSLFKKGGHIVAIGSWTIDGGAGSDDLFVIVTSNGEIAIYQGTDPASIATWSLSAIYEVAKPIGDKPLLDYGGDLLYLSATGLLPISKLAQSSFSRYSASVVISDASNISYNIDGAFLDAAANYSGVVGWQILTHKSTNMLLVNVPVVQDSQSYQLVMNTITQAWCRFIGWNASCWIDFNGDIYFAAATKVCKAWIGSNDSGQPITGVCAQAYSGLGINGQKQVDLVRPNFGFTGSAQLIMALDTDFKTFSGQTQFTYTPTSAGGIWDSGLWNTATWDAGVSLFDPKWTTVPGNLGYLHSFRLQVIASSGNFVWTSTNFASKPAGIL